MLKVSASYLEKQKSFIPKKNIFLAVVSKHANIIPKVGASRPSFQWRFWGIFLTNFWSSVFRKNLLFRLLLENICLLLILFCFVIITLQTGNIENIAFWQEWKNSTQNIASESCRVLQGLPCQSDWKLETNTYLNKFW